MKTKILYIVAMALMMGACSDEFTYPPMIVPEASIQPNTTIAQMKELYWQSGRNYCSTIRPLEDGTDMVIKGRVVSSDASGNIFKNVVIEDATAAITIAINAYDLNQSYQYGQNIVVNVTGLQIGGYNGLMQMGSEGTFSGAPSMTFMTKDLFDAHAEPDGLANSALVVPQVYTLPQLAEIKANQSQLCLTQSKLVKVEGVRFVDAGKQFAPTSNSDRYVVDKDGNRLNIRCSAYADFKNDIIPDGSGNVTGILSYYGSDWQMLLIDLDGLEGFTPATPSEPSTPDTPDTPDTPSGETQVYAALVDNADGWTIDNVSLPDGLSYVWQWDAQYKCLKASAFATKAYATDAYITTQVDLTGYKKATAVFDHVYRYGSDTQKSLTLVAREQGATVWTTLSIPNWPDGTNWTFISSGAVDLAAFAGKKIDIGFRYTSTADAAATWEIKNIKISAAK